MRETRQSAANGPATTDFGHTPATLPRPQLPCGKVESERYRARSRGRCRPETVDSRHTATHTRDRSPTVWFNGAMASLTDTATGRSDLEPFWPSRQAHAFDRLCCRAH
ncbi:hypothetical protein JCM4914_54040 [Streptomyces platensis subsp. malvinus]